MSYSFQVIAANKQEAKNAVFTKLTEVVAGQPDHAADSEQAYTAACAFIDVVDDNPDKDVFCNVSGSLSWGGTVAAHVYTNAGINISAGCLDRSAH